MGTSAGYAHAVHDRMCAMHKLDIQARPSPNVMVFMGTQDTLSKVAMLNIALEDTLAYCTVHEFSAGFKTVPAFADHSEQRLVRRGHPVLRTECWQLLPLFRRDGAWTQRACRARWPG